MHTYERSVRVAAPFEEVWDFHSTEKGLEALTPDWMGMEIESVTGPDGESDPDVLETGATIHASVRPFGVGPRQRWVSEIVARDRSDGSGFFRDTMDDGPFPEWEHTHNFYADGEETVIRDHVEYELPLGPLDGLFGPLAVVGFEPMFRYRHRQTRSLLES
ncbi:SRPBCC family protein [Halovenus salina]|uniref:SRPBCC family protein n=1 Tax=Halovenus salina TaxID=1510225 RepID=A0ABD5VWT8_9EURY|nr:SRPBCC family protein [Halovenus salina]